jgi:hypothetical protein
MRSGSPYGRGFNNTPFTKLKIAVLASIPMASVKTATVANPGLFRRVRIP